MNNHDDSNNENNTNNIDIMTITITTVMAMVIIRYLFVYMLTQGLNGHVQNGQEYTKNDVITYKETKIKYEQNPRREKSKILQFN
jgi:hypothetical protein